MSSSDDVATIDDLRDAIEAASAAGDLPKVKALVESWSTASTGSTPSRDASRPEPDKPLKEALQAALTEAAENGHAEVVSFLLERGANITSAALRGGRDSRSTSVFQAFLDHGWDINSMWWAGITSLGSVVQYGDLVKWHLEHGADPNIPSRLGAAPLEGAAYHNALDSVKALVSHGAALQNTSALVSAAANDNADPGCFEVIDFLLDQGVDINGLERGVDAQGDSLDLTVFAGTALHRAVERNDASRVRFLLQRGADRQVKGLKGLTPLEAAEARGLSDMADILRNE